MSVKHLIFRSSPKFLGPVLRRIEASPLGYRLAKGAFWSLVGAVVSRLFGLASVVLVARVLGIAGFGRFGVVQSTVNMFGVFAGFGLGLTATKYVAELRSSDPQRAGRIMGMAGVVAFGTGLLMAAALYALAPWLAVRTLADSSLAPLLRIGAMILVFEAMNGTQMGALAGFEAFKTIARIQAWSSLASLPMMAVGVLLGGLQGSVWALLANRGLCWFWSHLALRAEARRASVPFVLRWSTSECSVLWRYSLPSTLTGLMVTPTLWICNAMLVNQPSGYEQMGIFQAASSFNQILLFMGNSLSAPLLPMLAHGLGSGQPNERLARLNIIATWALGALPAAVLLALPEIALVVYGQAYSGTPFVQTSC
jgi:O-antigen/teichoic acid export membrane protein